MLKLQEKKLEHDGLYTQLENLRQEASAKDGVDQKAIAALSNIRETVEISERQLRRLTEEVSVAGEQLSECWQHDTIPRVRALHDNIKAQLTHEGKQLIDANFVKNPHIWADQAVRSSYKPLKALEGIAWNIAGLTGTSNKPEENLKHARGSAGPIEQLIAFEG